MLTTFYPPYHFGGDALHVLRLSRALSERGHHVEVIHSIDAYRLLSDGAPRPGSFDLPGVRVHPLRSALGPLDLIATHQAGRPIAQRRKIRTLLEQGDFSVIHYHNISLMGGPSVLGIGTAIKLYTLHEHWLVCPMHILWRNGREVCSRRTCVRCQLVGRRPPQLWRFTGLRERSTRHVDCFIAPSRFTLEKHRSLGVDGRMRHIPHFAPELAPTTGSTETKPSAANQSERSFFVFAGRLERSKGIDTLARVFRRYRNADLMIVGEGSDRARLREAVHDLPHVQLLGYRDASELSELYRRAVAVIVPSECYETFGLTVVEALSVGTPAIVRRLGSLPELVEQSETGIAFGTDDELIDALKRLHDNPSLRSEMGARGRETQLQRWSEAAYVSAYEELVREIEQSRGRS